MREAPPQPTDYKEPAVEEKKEEKKEIKIDFQEYGVTYPNMNNMVYIYNTKYPLRRIKFDKPGETYGDVEVTGEKFTDAEEVESTHWRMIPKPKGNDGENY